jgi:hypothetical protein
VVRDPTEERERREADQLRRRKIVGTPKCAAALGGSCISESGVSNMAHHYIFRPITDDDYIGFEIPTKLDNDYLQAMFSSPHATFPYSVMPLTKSAYRETNRRHADWFEGLAYRNDKRIMWDGEAE